MEGTPNAHQRSASSDRQGEERLRQLCEENTSEVLERITEDFFAVDCEWRYTYLNEQALRRIRSAKGEDLARDDLLGKRVWEVFPEQVGSVCYRRYHEALSTQEALEFEAYLPLTEESYRVNAYPSVDGLSIFIRDITERKRTEEELRKSEERFRAQYKSFPLPTFTFRRIQDDFELVDYNEAANRITRGGMAGLIGKRASEWYADKPQILAMLSRSFREKATVQDEVPWQMVTTGERRHFAVTFVYTAPDLVIHYAEDITERKRAEEALEESHTLLRSIIEATPDPIFLKDVAGRYLLANSAAGEILGRSAEELLGKDNTEFMPPEAAKRIMEFDQRVMESGESKTGEERLVVRGKTRTFLFTKTPYRNSEGEAAGVIGIARDITERERAEESLRRSKERFHSLIRHSSDIISVLTADGTFSYSSPAIERLAGYGAEEVIGKSAFDFVHPEDLGQVLEKFTLLLSEPGTQASAEFRFRHKDGSWRYQEAFCTNLLRDPGVEGIVVNSRDTTERKSLEEKQQRFLANAAHQLKTPLTTIVGAAELLTTKQDLDATGRRQLLDHIFSEGRRMQRLSDNLLRLARVGRDRRDPALQTVDLTEAARQAATRMMPLAENLGLALRVEGDDARALADPEWLQEVLLVLLGNAAKHSGPEQVIRLRASENAITVEDEGTGISDSDLPYVFERFYRGKGTTEGFGLGLSIGRELVERMGGSITVGSREDSGTRVVVRLADADTNA